MQDNNSKTLFRANMRAATPLFVYLLISMFSSFAVGIGWVLARHMTSLAGSDLNAMEDVLQTALSQDYNMITVISMVVEYVLMIPIFAFMMMQDQKNLLLTGKIKKAPEIPKVFYLLIVVCGVAFCIGGSNVVALSGLAGESESYQATQEVFNSMALPAQTILLGLVAPVAEELLFRGLIYKRFRLGQPLLLAVGWSALVFAMLHGNMVQGIYAFVLGVVLCFVYYRYGTILAPILMHITINITSVILNEYLLSYPGLGTFFGVTFISFAVIIACLYAEEVYVRPLSEDVFILEKTQEQSR